MNNQNTKRVFWKSRLFWLGAIIAIYLLLLGMEETAYKAFNREWTIYTTENSPLLSDEIGALATDDKGQIWVGTKNGLYTISKDGAWSKYADGNPALSNNFISALIIDKRGWLWIGTWDGLYVDEQNGSFRTLIGAGCRGCLSSITDLDMDRHGRVWVSTLAGLYIYDIGEQQTARIEDRSGEMLTIYEPGITKTAYTKENSDLTDSIIRALAIDRFDRVWIGTHEHGINVLDQDDHWTSYQTDRMNPSRHELISNEIQELLIDKQDRVWVGTNRGLSILDPKGTWTSYSYPHWRVVPGFESNYSSAYSNSVRAFALDKDGLVWMGTGAELVLVDSRKSLLTYTSENSGLPDGADALLIDANNRLWVGTSEGLAVIDLKTASPKTIPFRPILLAPVRFITYVAWTLIFPVFLPGFGLFYGLLLLLLIPTGIALGRGIKRKDAKLFVRWMLVFVLFVIMAAALWFLALRLVVGD